MPLANADSFRIPLADKSVHMIVTSTPYFGLRIYSGVQPTVFGGRSDCEHIWVTSQHDPQPHGDDGYSESSGLEGGKTTQAQTRGLTVEVAECSLCGAWRGFFGGERLHDCNAWARGEPPCEKCFVCHFRELAAEMWRVLRDDGTCWLVIGDCYSGSAKGMGADGQCYAGPKQATNVGSVGTGKLDWRHTGLKPKDKMMIPERVRLALQADGWTVRSVASWLKVNSMPESVEDRPGTAHEDIILLAKSKQYYYDHIAVRKMKAATSLASQTRGVSDHHKNVDGAPGQPPHSMNQPRSNVNTFSRRNDRTEESSFVRRKNLANTFARPSGKNTTLEIPGQSAPSHRADRDDECTPGRNRRTTDWFFDGLDGMIEDAESSLAYMRSVRDKGGLMLDENGNPLAFLVNPKGYKGAHYATFPESLVTPMILAGTSEKGVCPKCGAPWERMIEKGLTDHDGETDTQYQKGMAANRLALLRQAARERGGEYINGTRTIGWQPTCDCGVCDDEDLGGDSVTNHAPDPVPAIVLDPFVGSGTTVEAARNLGRIGIGLDISLRYLRENALPRAERTNTKASMATLPLFAPATTEAELQTLEAEDGA